MSDSPIEDLTALSQASSDDLFVVVDDPSGTPVTKKITKANLMGGTNVVQAVGTTETQTLTNKTLTSPKINEDVAVTATATELNYTDGVTSAIQTQLDAKAALVSPSFTTPTLGVATATSINKVTITAPASSATLTIANTGSLITSGAYAITLTATDTTGVTLPTSGTLYGTASGSITSSQLATSLSDETGSGAAVFGTNPTIAKPVMNATNPTAQTYSPSADGTATLDLSLANQHYITMPEGNITIALSNDTNNQIFYVTILQDSGGSRTVTWFSTIRWAGGSAPTLTTTASKRDAFIFVRTGSGTYDGFVCGQNI